MQGPSWIALFQRIPTKLHDTLALTMSTGAEILMQSVLRLESDYAIIRGRMSGSTDAGKVLILPYDQIVNLGFTKRMLEAEVQAVFGKTLESPTGEAAPAPAEVEEAPAEVSEPVDEVEEEEAPTQGVSMQMRTALHNPAPAQPASAPPSTAAPGKNPPPSKSILLARLRARLAEQGK